MRQEALHTMLDGLSELIYVCDTENYQLLYLNEEGRRIYDIDAADDGRLCYQVLQGREEPARSVRTSSCRMTPSSNGNSQTP